MVKGYVEKIQDFVLRSVGDLDSAYFDYFHMDDETCAILSKGEKDLLVEQEGKIAANRRVTLNFWGVRRDTQEEELDVKWGSSL